MHTWKKKVRKKYRYCILNKNNETQLPHLHDALINSGSYSYSIQQGIEFSSNGNGHWPNESVCKSLKSWLACEKMLASYLSLKKDFPQGTERSDHNRIRAQRSFFTHLMFFDACHWNSDCPTHASDTTTDSGSQRQKTSHFADVVVNKLYYVIHVYYVSWRFIGGRATAFLWIYNKPPLVCWLKVAALNTQAFHGSVSEHESFKSNPELPFLPNVFIKAHEGRNMCFLLQAST